MLLMEEAIIEAICFLIGVNCISKLRSKLLGKGKVENVGDDREWNDAPNRFTSCV